MKKTKLGENLTTEMILSKKMTEMFMQIERNDYAKTVEGNAENKHQRCSKKRGASMKLRAARLKRKLRKMFG